MDIGLGVPSGADSWKVVERAEALGFDYAWFYDTQQLCGDVFVAMAASASFTSPISHPANILVMGPGGYRFADYLKLGLPLTVVVFVTVMLLLPLVWPLTAVSP